MAARGNDSRTAIAVRLAADARAVARALAAADEFLIASAADDDMRARLSIIVEELVINIVEHGDPRDDDVIGLSLRAEADGVRMTLTDGGAPFDLRDWTRDGELPPERGGGAGIALVLAWARIVGYVRANERNRLELFIPAEDRRTDP